MDRGRLLRSEEQQMQSNITGAKTMSVKRFLAITALCGFGVIVCATAWATSAAPSQAARTATVLYVDADASGVNTGLSWTDAFTDVQSAILTATAGIEIWVAEGVY